MKHRRPPVSRDILLSMNPASYWSGRFTSFGHTGWSNPVIYCYDQPERLSIIESAILKWSIRTGSALDFGCGTGDFSKLLLQLGYAVCGYDPYVRPPVSSSQFSYADSYESIPFEQHEATLVLSVTTLDHILEEGAFRRALAVIHRLLNPAGIFILLEYALDSATDRELFGLNNDYQAFRTLADWRAHLGEAGFSVVEVMPAPHPLLNPSTGFLKYSRSSTVRMRNLCKRVPMVRSWFNPWLKHAAGQVIREIRPELKPATVSPLKLICCLPA